MKMINDECGHQAAYQALLDIANVLRKSFRVPDIIARIGGDEFIVLIAEPSRIGFEKAVTHNIEEKIRMHNETKGRPYILTVSMGIAHFSPKNPCTLKELICSADELMYENKQLHILQKEGIPLPTLKKSEKRIDKRMQVDNTFEAELLMPNNAEVRNISRNGICVRTPKSLKKFDLQN